MAMTIIQRVSRVVAAAISAGANSAKYTWRVTSSDYDPGAAARAHAAELEAERQERAAKLARVMRPLHEKMLRDALRGPFAPREETPQA